jgi:hypothetical protein
MFTTTYYVMYILVFWLNSVQWLYEWEFSLTKNLIAGSTQATRFTAARQIGDIAKSHPQDLTSLLKKVLLIAVCFFFWLRY